MDNYPTVAVLLPTYERPDVLDRTVELLQKNLHYAGKLQVLIGDDSSNEHFVGILDGPPERIPVWYSFHGEQYGLGKNLNSLLQTAQSISIDIVLQMDDDHWLMEPLDITPYVEKLFSDRNAGCIRLMGLGGHRYTATLDGLYWRISWESAEVYIASNRPHLKSISKFHGAYGFYPEGKKLGLTEEMFCHNCIDAAKLNLIRGFPTMDVLIPLDLISERGWQHNEHHGAVSWQSRGF